MPKDYIPYNDAEFLTWAQSWLAYATAHAAAIGLTADEIAALEAKVMVLTTAMEAHALSQNDAQAKRQTKDRLRDDACADLRAASQRVQVCPTTTDTDRAGLGITVRDGEGSPVPIAETRPIATVNTAQRFRHDLRWRDELTGRRGKPDGMQGCEVWVKVGEPPTDPSECRYLGMDSRCRFIAEYPGSEAGKIAHYMLRWVSTRGTRGPWSETASATIQN